MPLIAKEPETVERELIPEDTYHMVNQSVIDLGTQHNELFGTDTRRCMITFEIPELRIEVERDGKIVSLPKVISKEYNLSLHPKSALRKALELWRGRGFTPEELNGFDLSRLLGANAMVTVIHKISQTTGKPYHTIASINKAYKGLPKLEPENEILYFSFDDDMEIPNNVPEWIVHKIMDSYEYQERLDKQLEGEPMEGEEVPF